jgi:hypothetical protein
MTILPSEPHIQVIWEYLVQPGGRQEFISIYSANGDWAQLFHRCPGFLRTELLHHPADNQKFLTIDFWQSLDTYQAMRQLISDDYVRLDRACATLTAAETFLGIYALTTAAM